MRFLVCSAWQQGDWCSGSSKKEKVKLREKLRLVTGCSGGRRGGRGVLCLICNFLPLPVEDITRSNFLHTSVIVRILLHYWPLPHHTVPALFWKTVRGGDGSPEVKPKPSSSICPPRQGVAGVGWGAGGGGSGGSRALGGGGGAIDAKEDSDKPPQGVMVLSEKMEQGPTGGWEEDVCCWLRFCGFAWERADGLTAINKTTIDSF